MTDFNDIIIQNPDPVIGFNDLIIGEAENVQNDGNPFEENLNTNEIHIRVYQRKSRKYVTTVNDLPEGLDLKKMVKFMKKNFSCNGVIKKDDSDKKVVHLTGDQRDNILKFLLDNKIAERREIKIHGF